jgi:hypothetical protein
MFRTLIVALIACVGLAATDGNAQDFVAVHETAVADTQQKATQEAYYAALERALTGATWYQAEGNVGAQLRSEFEQDFERFRQRFFMPDTDYRCARQDSGRYICEVEGTLKFGALQVHLRRQFKDIENGPQKHLTFAVSAAQVKDPRKQFVVDQLSGAFASWGHRILMDSAANAAIARHQVDYALGIYEVTFTNLDDPGAYDPYNLRLSGSLTVRFKVSQLKNGEMIANVPVVESGNEAGPNAELLKPKLVANLSKRAADEIARKVNAAVVSDQTDDAEGTP